MLKKFVCSLALISAPFWQGCEYEVVPAPVDCDENPVSLTISSVVNSSCSEADGAIEVAASGGSGQYSYSLGENTPQEGSVFTNVGAGVYTVTVVDENACSASQEVTVLNNDGLNISFSTTEAGGCTSSEGSLTVNAFDGTEPYLYRLGSGSYASGHVFTGLPRGEYQLTVSDATGCEVTQNVRIRSGISFAASIKPIIDTNCAINDCHNGSQFPDFRTFKNIHDNAGQIKALTADRTMPVDGTLTQAEINMIACWVDDGALNN